MVLVRRIVFNKNGIDFCIAVGKEKKVNYLGVEREISEEILVKYLSDLFLIISDWDKEYITFDSKSCDYWKLVIQFVDGEEKIFLGKAKYPSNFEMFLHLNRRMLEEVKE